MFAGSRQNFPAEIVGLSSEADLAVLRVQIAGGVPRVGALARDRAGLARGDPVAVLGYPLGFDLPMSRVGTAPVAEPTLTIGTVSKTLDDVLQLDGYGAPGSSGSPVFDGAGRVVGMVFGGERAAQGKIGYALPAAVIARYLRQLGIDASRLELIDRSQIIIAADARLVDDLAIEGDHNSVGVLNAYRADGPDHVVDRYRILTGDRKGMRDHEPVARTERQ
jgi:S1-C subfamily serine protease